MDNLLLATVAVVGKESFLNPGNFKNPVNPSPFVYLALHLIPVLVWPHLLCLPAIVTRPRISPCGAT